VVPSGLESARLGDGCADAVGLGSHSPPLLFAITLPNGASGYLLQRCEALLCMDVSISAASTASNGADAAGNLDSDYGDLCSCATSS
jgi:hypothetical protein